MPSSSSLDEQKIKRKIDNEVARLATLSSMSLRMKNNDLHGFNLPSPLRQIKWYPLFRQDMILYQKQELTREELPGLAKPEELIRNALACHSSLKGFIQQVGVSNHNQLSMHL